MTEWYVLIEDRMPTWVIMGRLDALNKLTDGFKVTRDEHRRLGKFLDGAVCDLGTGLHLVGYEDANGKKREDRRLIRVRGPGTEV